MSEPLSIDQALDRFSELVESVTSKRERVKITTADGGEVVLMNAADLEGLEETLEILNDQDSVAALKRSLDQAARGEFVDVDDLR
ncbi:MAG: type II toxin-antitoxin system Phd/YefM family antitoxin [Actinomycetota bacterium]